MVDIVSDAAGGRTIRRVSASFRLRSPATATSPAVRRVEAVGTELPQPRDPAQDDAMVRVCLEIQEDKSTGTVVYRLMDAASGAVIREWRGEELAELRKFLQENHIQLLDTRA
jgi:hypothetical protein